MRRFVGLGSLSQYDSSAPDSASAAASTKWLRFRWTVVAAMVLATWALLTFTVVLRLPSSSGGTGAVERARTPHLDVRPYVSLPSRHHRPYYSIVMPVYNQATTLESAVSSVVRQRYPFWELVLVDDGSTDRATIDLAYSLAAKSDGQVRLIATDNAGVSEARNVGIRAAVGEWILCLDADDAIHSSLLLRAHHAESLTAGAINVIAMDLTTADDTYRWQPLQDLAQLPHRNAFHVSCLFRKSVWLRAGGFSPAFFFGWEDWDFWLRAHAAAGLQPYYIREPLFTYRPGARHHLCQLAEPECRALMHSANCHHYNASRDALLDTHRVIMQSAVLPGNQPFLRALKRYGQTHPELLLWNGLRYEAERLYSRALLYYRMVLENLAPFDLDLDLDLDLVDTTNTASSPYARLFAWTAGEDMAQPSPATSNHMCIVRQALLRISIVQQQQQQHQSSLPRAPSSVVSALSSLTLTPTLNQLLLQPLGNSSTASSTTNNNTTTTDATTTTSSKPEKFKICIATREFWGLSMGGIGTAASNLALHLAEHDDFSVRVIYTPFHASQSEPRFVESSFASRRVLFTHLPWQGDVYAPDELKESFMLYDWLARHPNACDLLHYHEWAGLGYLTALAKHQRLLHFGSLRLAVTLHGPWAWALENQQLHIGSLTPIMIDHMERVSVALADHIYAPSRYIVEHLVHQRHWEFDASRVRLVQNVNGMLSRSVFADVTRVPSTWSAVTGFAFFGKTDAFKGLPLFCDAVDLLVARGAWHRTWRLVFLVRLKLLASGVGGAEYIAQRARNWPAFLHYEIVTDKDTDQCMHYLSDERLVAVMPSTVSENSPYVVLECLENHIPFIATMVGGTPELVHSGDHPYVLVAPNAEALYARLKPIINTAKAYVARIAISTQQTKDLWTMEHHRMLHQQSASQSSPTTNGAFNQASDSSEHEPSDDKTEPPSRYPRITIILPHQPIGDLALPYLYATLQSISRQQDFPLNHLHVWIVDFSTDHQLVAEEVAQALLPSDDDSTWRNTDDTLPAIPHLNIFRVASSSTPYGRAINWAARRASIDTRLDSSSIRRPRSEHLVQILNQADLLMPHHMALFHSVFAATNCSLAFNDQWHIKTAQPDDAEADAYLPLRPGAPLAAGVLVNAFGSSTVMMQIEDFLELGGFLNNTNSNQVSLLEWEFHVRAAASPLLQGRIEKVPEPTSFRRLPAIHSPRADMASLLPDSLLRYNRTMTALSPIVHQLPSSLAAIIDLSCGLYNRVMQDTIAAASEKQWWLR